MCSYINSTPRNVVEGGMKYVLVLVRITACLKLVNLAHPNANLLTLLHRCPQQRIVGSCVLKAWRPSVGAPPGKERVGHDQLLPSLQGGCHFQGMVTFLCHLREGAGIQMSLGPDNR